MLLRLLGFAVFDSYSVMQVRALQTRALKPLLSLTTKDGAERNSFGEKSHELFGFKALVLLLRKEFLFFYMFI
jgi:hypothetical protein